MYLKKSVWILLGSILVLTVSLSACSGGTPTSRTLTVSPPTIGATRWVNDFSELPKGTASHVDVVYFHRSVRCEACLNAENYTRETLAKYFAPQMQSGLISLQVLDMELPQNSDACEKIRCCRFITLSEHSDSRYRVSLSESRHLVLHEQQVSVR